MSLEVQNISKSFGDNNVLSDVSFRLPEAHISVLMGTNGSGKTTLFNIISGFLKPDSGQILIDEKLILDLEPDQIQLMGVGRTFQDLRLIGSMSVFENVMLAFPKQEGEKWWNTLLPSKKVAKEQNDNVPKAFDILKQCFIEDAANQKASELSYGQQKLLNLACCMASGTSIWLLDEPVAGVNPSFRDQLSNVIKQQKEIGKSILVIEHNSDFITNVADEILFLDKGVVEHFSSYQEFKSDDEVKNAYV